MEITLFAALGFLFAAYAVVGNDALQTLGTFINSNSKLHWFWLFLFAGSILVATFTYGWVVNGGDPSWGRLANTTKYPWPEGGIQWYHTLPPLALLIITRFGIPVSTSFMVLTVFASVGGMTSMLSKSLMGYGLAFIVGLLVYLVLSRNLEKYFKTNDVNHKAPWGLATIMGLLIAAAIYVLPEMIMSCDPGTLTDAKDIKSCNKALGKIASYKASGLSIILLGVLVDLVALAAHEKHTNKLMDAGIATVTGAIIWYFMSRLGVPMWAAIGAGLAMAAFIFWVAERFAAGNGIYWVLLQWITTGYLWGVWLIQDFANIFVFLPRQISAFESFVAMGAILLLLAYTFWNKGGPVQKILQAKTAVTDIRSATIIDFIYASLLFFFKEVSAIPMSTTFVFLGLIAGREYGFALMDKSLSFFKACKLSLSDLSKAFIGLVISIDMAVGLPMLSKYLTGKAILLPSQSYQIFILVANLLLIPVAFYLMKQDSKIRMAVTGSLLSLAAIAFFTTPPV